MTNRLYRPGLVGPLTIAMFTLVGACGGSSPPAQGRGGTHGGGGGGAAGSTGVGGGAAATGGGAAATGGGAGSATGGASGSGGSGAAAVLTISDGPTYDFGAWGTGATATHVFVLSNSGTGVATGVSISGAIGPSYGYAGGAFPGLGGTCTTTLGGGSACALVVTFSPATAATFTGSIAIAYNDGAAAQTATRAVTGVGTALAAVAITDWPPAYYASYGLTPDAPVFDFGQVGIGSPLDHTFIVTNNGGAAATITAGSALAAPYSYPGGAFPGSGGKCAGVLAPGTSCSVVVRYTGTAGTSPSSFTVDYTGGVTASVTRNLTGTGTSAAALQIYDFATGQSGIDLGASWEFGTVGLGGQAEHTFIIINSGAAAATALAAGPASAPFAYPGGFPGGTAGAPAPNSGDTTLPYCGTTLAAGTACAVLVRFTPTAAGSVSGAVAISYDTTSTASRSVKGVGTDLAFVSVVEENQKGLLFDYGTRAVASTTSQIFFVTNGGGQAATELTVATLPIGFAFSGTGFPGGTGTYTDRNGTGRPYCTTGSLAPGATCAMSVDFKPTASVTYAGTIGVSYGDGSGTTATATRAVQGSGTTQAIVSIGNCRDCGGGGGDKGNTADLGTVAVNATRTLFAFVTNSGSTSAVLGDGGLTGGSFTYPGGAYPGGTGTANANGSSYPFCGPAPYTLVGGATCVVQILYTAPATSGTQSGNLTVTTGSATTASVSMPLAAASTSLAVVSMTNCVDCGGGGGGGTPTQDFGLVRAGSSSSVYFVVSNSGGSAATLAPGTLTGGPAFDYTGGSYPGATAGSAIQLNGKTFNFCPASGGSLPAGSRCVIGLTYAASGTVTQTGSLSLAVGNATTSSLGYNLSGTPTALAIVSISDSDCGQCGGGGPGPRTHDFGQVASGSVNTTYFFISNAGAGAATLTDSGISGAAFSYTGGSYPGGTAGSQVMVNGNSWGFCPASGGSLPGGSRCVLSVTYTASGSAPQTGGFAIAVTGGTSNSLAYSLRGAPSSLAIVTIFECTNCGGGGQGTPTHDFGSVPSGGTQSVFLFLRNSGASAATLTDNGVTGSGFSYTMDDYPGGAPGGGVQADGGNYTFCPTSGGSLAAGATCVLSVTYAASGTTQQSGNLSIGLGNATAPSLAYHFVASPTDKAVISMNDCANCGGPGGPGSGNPSHDFGFVATSSTRTAYFFLDNAGTSAATLTEGGLTGAAYAYAGSGYPGGTPSSTVDIAGGSYDLCPASGGTLAGGARCVVAVVYSASGSAVQTGVLSITLGGATTSAVGYNLTGTPTALAIVSLGNGPGGGGCCGNPPTQDFGTVAAGSVNTTFFFLQNSGSADAIVTNPTITGAAFTFAGGAYPGGSAGASVDVWGDSYHYCPAAGAALVAGAGCVIGVSYTASGTAMQSGSMSLTLTGATTPTLTYGLAGHPTTSAIVSLAPCVGCGNGGNFDFGTAGTNLDTILVVQNGGLGSAGLADGSTLTAPFTYSSGSFPGGTGTTNAFGQSLAFCSATLAAGADCAVSIRYSGAATGQGVLTLNLTGASSPTVTMTVTGARTDRALLTVNENEGFFGCTNCGPSDFGALTSPNYTSRDFFVSNRGALATTALDVGMALATPFSFGPMGSGAYPGGTGSKIINGISYAYCGAVLSPGAQCLVTVNLAPAAGAGVYDTAINLSYSDSMGASAENAIRDVTGASN